MLDMGSWLEILALVELSKEPKWPKVLTESSRQSDSPKRVSRTVQNSVSHCPNNLLSLFFALKAIFYFSEVIFKDPLNIPFETSIEITPRGYLNCLSFFFLPGEVISNN